MAATDGQGDAAQAGQGAIRVNQVGFVPGAKKLAVVPSGKARQFHVIKAGTDTVVLSGPLGAPAVWAVAADTVRLADFSALQEPGRYQLRVEGVADSHPFGVAANQYSALNAAALKFFYYNRAGTALLQAHAGVFARPSGHPDDNVVVHASAATAQRPEGSLISAPRGWYDAGDYNKYIVNSGISTYTLLAAFEHFPEYYKAQNLQIPESEDAVPDLLNEVMWNLQWMLAMQDDDGGVYHKLTEKNFSGFVMPDQVHSTRYVVQKTTAATLDFAAVMASASRVYASYGSSYPGAAAQMRAAAEKAWAWAQANPAIAYRQPSDIKTGAYADNTLADEFTWAAAELYITTRDDRYYRAIGPEVPNAVPAWADVRGLAWISLAHHRKQLTAVADQALIASRIQVLADALLRQWQTSAYAVPMEPRDFKWGSNSFAANQAIMLIQGYRLGGNRAYLDAAQSLLDYLLGRNPTGYSFVTRFGTRPAMHPHHRVSAADGVVAPVPGMLVGGPQPAQQDANECNVPYPTRLPAKSYLDDVCSYASNEVAINWNAPLVYVTGALQVLGR